LAKDSDPGRSIVLVRTERGRAILRGAREAGYVTLERKDSGALMAAQPNLLARRREIFGRLLARRILLMPIPQFTGFSLLRSWLRIPTILKARTIFGSLSRLIQRGYWHRRSPF
jgi:coenzyme F420 hydrogenase subunit beta